jgi:phosphinothricin acetyltransferase
MSVRIRPAASEDAPAIAAIYDHHARHSTATFDIAGPDEAEWVSKISKVRGRGWPFLVAADDDEVVGYGYATQFRDRPGYALSAESSIYIAHDRVSEGIGSLLLAELIERAQASGFEQLIAVIGGAAPASVALHRKFGFELRGRMKAVGIKFGQKLDTVYLQRALGSGGD